MKQNEPKLSVTCDPSKFTVVANGNYTAVSSDLGIGTGEGSKAWPDSLYVTSDGSNDSETLAGGRYIGSEGEDAHGMWYGGSDLPRVLLYDADVIFTLVNA